MKYSNQVRVWDKLTRACMHSALRSLVPDGQAQRFSQEGHLPHEQCFCGFQVAEASTND